MTSSVFKKLPTCRKIPFINSSFSPGAACFLALGNPAQCGSAPQGSIRAKIWHPLPNRIRPVRGDRPPRLTAFPRLRRECFSRKRPCENIAPTPQRMRPVRGEVLHRRCPKEAFVQKYGTHSPIECVKRPPHRTFGVSAAFGGSAFQGSIRAKIWHPLPRESTPLGVRCCTAGAAPSVFLPPSAEVLSKKALIQRYRRCSPENARSDCRTAGAPRKHSCKDMASTSQKIHAVRREVPRCKRPPHRRC